MLLLELLFWALALYFGLSIGFTLLFSLAAFLPQRRRSRPDAPPMRFLVLIPAYKEDGVIVRTAEAALRQDYPAEHFEVCVIADQLKPATLERLRALPLRVVEVFFETSTKAKAINHALSVLPGDYGAAVILDADNEMAPGFLRRANGILSTGIKAVQGQRAAKNSNTDTAKLDGLSEAVNNRIYCMGHNALGLSTRLAGSGMAFEFQLFKTVMAETDAVGGFDKEMEVRITSRGHFMAYDHGAIVLDEKVSKDANFYKQRKRWLSAQYANLRKFLPTALRALLRGNVDCFHRVIQMALPPRLSMPVVAALLAAIGWASGYYPWVGTALLLGVVLGYGLAIPRYFWAEGHWRSLLHLPVAIFQTLRAIVGLKGANKTFIHTPHGDDTH